MRIYRTTSYEWIVEDIDEHGEIHDTNGYPTLAEALHWASKSEGKCHIGLVRDWGSQETMLEDRQWAYLTTDGKLRDEFTYGSKIPKRFFAEVARFSSEALAKFGVSETELE